MRTTITAKELAERIESLRVNPGTENCVQLLQQEGEKIYQLPSSSQRINVLLIQRGRDRRARKEGRAIPGLAELVANLSNATCDKVLILDVLLENWLSLS